MNWKFWKRNKVSNTAGPDENAVKHSVSFIVVRVDGDGNQIDFKITSDTDLDDALQKSVWAFAAMQRNTQAVCSVAPVIEQVNKTTGRYEPLPFGKGPRALRRLIQTPAGTARLPLMSWSDWLEVVFYQLYIFGRSYLDVRAGSMVPLLSPLNVEPVRNDQGILVSWMYGSVEYRPEELIQLHVSGADGYYSNTSPFEAATGAIVSDSTAAERARYNLVNRVAPGLIFKIPDAYMDDTSREETAKWLVTQYQASSQSGMPMVLTQESEVVAPPDYKAMTEELFGAAKMARDSILAVFGTPPPVLGIYDQATLSNFEKSYKIWWEAILLPQLGHLLNQLNVQYIQPQFGSDIRVAYGLENTEIGIIRESARADLAKKYFDLGYPANIAAAEAGLNLPYHAELDLANAKWVTAGRTDMVIGDGQSGSNSEEESS